MTNPSTGYVTVLATSYLEPISTLLEALENLNPPEPNEVQATSLDNGYSVSVIVLAILMLESAIVRTQYIQKVKPPKKPLDFVRSMYPAFLDDLTELFVVRDTIAHNHLWEGQLIWDQQMNMKAVGSPAHISGGDPKFHKVIDPTNRKTQKLQINLVPIKICRADAGIVLKKVVEFLLFLENEDPSYIYISPQSVKFKGHFVQFVDLIDKL